jgi:peptidoglycan/xylan/chitin deacetylase (PgdA/CDA1 family)
MSFARRLLAASFVLFSTTIGAYAQLPLTRDTLISECCRLTEERRYADAVPMAERLRLTRPKDAGGLIAAGAVALQTGAISIAVSSFNAALVRSPHDPLALYGEALAEMMDNQTADALTLLNNIDVSILSPAAISDISMGRAICLAEAGNTTQALESAGGNPDAASQELTALIKFRQDPGDNSLLKNCLYQAMTNGLPVVTEPPGLRLLLPQSQTGPPIEPSIVNPAIQQDLTSRFDSSYISSGLKIMIGRLTISPPRRTAVGTRFVSFAVDGQGSGESNLPPYRFTWDSHTMANGRHTIYFTMYGGSGNELQVQAEDVYVLNADSSDGNASNSLTSDQSDRIWKLLQVNPDYKVAEYELAIALNGRGDRDGYETHILRAAALDPDYRDVRSRIRPLFAGQTPAKFPVPDGTTLPSSLGLSAGAASAAGFWAGSPHSREIALTFDDGPLPIPTQRLLDALHNANAVGTFFVVGMRAVESPDSLRQMAAYGDCVEDHSFTHPNLTQILPGDILPEILRTAVIIQAATGKWPHFLRPPGGNTNSQVLQTARICGLSGAFWTIDALPAEESGSAQAVSNWVISRARPGAIVLMHNDIDTTVEAIRQLAADALSTPDSAT